MSVFSQISILLTFGAHLWPKSMFNYSFFKTRINIVLALLRHYSFSKFNNLFISIISFILKRKNSGKTPVLLGLYLTYECNLSCIMCQKNSVDENVYTRPASMDFAMLTSLLRKHHRTLSIVRLHGGEPFMYAHFEELIDLLNELKLKYTILSNATHITPALAAKLMKNCIQLSFSIDSADPEMYAKIRRGADLRMVEQNIQCINDLKKQKRQSTPILNLASVMFTFNISGIADLVRFCNKYNIPSMSASEGSFYNTPYITDEHLLVNHIERIGAAVNEAQEEADRLGITLRLTSPLLFWKKGENTLIAHRNKITNCFNFYFGGYFDPYFDFSLCPLSAPVGNLNHDDLTALWNGNTSPVVKGRITINNNAFPETCRYCPSYNKEYLEKKDGYSYTSVQKEQRYWTNIPKH